jgi:hypothetical protein
VVSHWLKAYLTPKSLLPTSRPFASLLSEKEEAKKICHPCVLIVLAKKPS